MAFKTYKGIYADRPLLTEDELEFCLKAVEQYPALDEHIAILRERCLEKLHKSKRRITMLQLNK